MTVGFHQAMPEATAKHEAEELFSGQQRDVIAKEAFRRMRNDLAPYGVEVERVLLRDISPPETLKRAIEAKQQAEHLGALSEWRDFAAHASSIPSRRNRAASSLF